MIWRKSTYSGEHNCFEVAWRSSTYSAEHDCVEVAWRSSTYSGDHNCVEVAWPTVSVAVRDSKNAAGPMLMFGRDQFAYFSASASAVHLSPQS
jgi:hypothetical protein